MPTPTTRTLNPLPFNVLEPKRFEDLVRQLAYDFRRWRMLDATGRTGSDEGYDARGFEVTTDDTEVDTQDDDDDALPERTTDRLWLIQCKRERAVGPAKMRQHLGGIADDEARDLYGIIFAAACDFSIATRDVLHKWCRERGISEVHVWGKGEIEDQLFQPKNDHLLFAYFGISLQIRRRSVRTAVRAKLAIKRKCERVFGEKKYSDVLLIDPEDERYPYPPSEDDDEGKQEPPRWEVRQFLKLHPWGVVVLVKRFHAYLAPDGESWDCIDDMPDDENENHNNWWRRELSRNPEEQERRRRANRFWLALPRQSQAWLMETKLIRFENIYDIDETGDSFAKFPHIFVPVNIPVGRHKYIEAIDSFWPRTAEPCDDKRVKFFPDEFPEPPLEVVSQ